MLIVSIKKKRNTNININDFGISLPNSLFSKNNFLFKSNLNLMSTKHVWISNGTDN